MPVGGSVPGTIGVTPTGIVAKAPGAVNGPRPVGIAASPVGLKSSLLPKEIVEQWPGKVPLEAVPQQELQQEPQSVQVESEVPVQQQGVATGAVVVEPDDGTPIEGVDKQATNWNKNPFAVDSVARGIFAPATIIFNTRKGGH